MSKPQMSKNRVFGFCSDLGQPVPLKSINVSINVFGYVAEVTSKLTYHNEEDTPINAVYTFPADDSSAVFAFEAEIDGRHIVAKIQSTKQAELTYQDAEDKGKIAALLRQDNSAGDIFCCKLGNLPSKSEALLTMKYVIELPQEPDGKLRFTLPTILNPRYSPDVGGEVAAKGAMYVPPVKVPYSFNMTALVQGYFRVKSVTSDVIQLRVDLLENQRIAEVSLDEPFKFDHDLTFLIEYETSFEPQVVLEPGRPEADSFLSNDILMVSFHPDLKEVTMATSGEFVFLIDRSGSMSGSKINDAKEALLLFLKSLPPNSHFNVVSFGTKFKCLFSSASKPYNEKNLKKALELCGKMKADMGGTEILKPLQEIFKQKSIKGHQRFVFVLTDGQVNNTDAVTALVNKQAKATDTRVFSIGIGEGASTALVKGIATNGNGRAEFIYGGTRLQSKVVSLLKCAIQPAVTGIDITWDLPPGINPMIIPEPPSMVMAGERLTLFVVLSDVDVNTVYAPSTVTVSGKQDNRVVSFSMNFTLSEDDNPSTSAPIHRLAMKKYIQVLQTQESQLVNLDAYPYGHPAEMKEMRSKIIDLSCHSNVISKFTAFVAVDEEGKAVDTEAMERKCPIPALSQNFIEAITTCELDCSGLLDGALDGSPPPSARSAPPTSGFLKKSKKSMFSGSRSRSSAVADMEELCALETGASEVGYLLDECDESYEDMGPSGADIMPVISLQQIQGQWLYSKALLDVLSITKDDFEKLKFSKDLSVISTIIALSWLRYHCSNSHEEWQMIEAKALAWLSGNTNINIEENITLATETLWSK